jgi:hypothetical protein
MSGEPNNPSETELDRATTRRLARLRTMPVDTSRLDALIQARIPRATAGQPLVLRWLSPLRAVAASLLVVAAVIALLIMMAGRPALASASEMARMHEDIVSGKTPVMQVDSIDAANKILAAQWPDSPGIPGMPADHVMACCMKSVNNKKVACVLLKDQGEPVTLTVANATDMKTPTCPTKLRRGVPYHVQSSGSLNMVMSERDGRWICIIAEAPVDRLMDLADGLKF